MEYVEIKSTSYELRVYCEYNLGANAVLVLPDICVDFVCGSPKPKCGSGCIT